MANKEHFEKVLDHMLQVTKPGTPVLDFIMDISERLVDIDVRDRESGLDMAKTMQEVIRDRIGKESFMELMTDMLLSKGTIGKYFSCGSLLLDVKTEPSEVVFVNMSKRYDA